MDDTQDQFLTERLVIRRFTTGDWAAIQELAKDINASDAGKYDCLWPVSDTECKGLADYFAKSDYSWAVCLKSDKTLIGYICYNNIDTDKRLDIGHVFHSRYYTADYDTEAIECMIDYAFAHLDIKSVYALNVEEWTVQLAPLKKLGLRSITPGRMEVTREEWLHRDKKTDA